MHTDTRRYTTVAIALHWIMGIAFILMLCSGLAMAQNDFLEKSLQFQMYQWHKSLGVLLLITFFLRIGWRLFHKAPPLPDDINKVEKVAAKGGHYALYIWMLIVPLTGWLMVSSSVYGLPTVVFGWFTWPHIPGVAGSEPINDFAHSAHKYLAYFFIALIAGHIAAVIKHAVIDKHNLLPRMWFGALLALMVMPLPANAADYIVDKDESSITFVGEHAGDEFTGTFTDWDATISFAADDLKNSKIKVVIRTESAQTGNKMYDGTLPQTDWFDSKNYPEAVFESTAITQKDDETFQVEGNLTIKQITNPVSFDFSLIVPEGQPAKAEAEFEIDRLLFGLGVKSDPNSEWVSEDIKMQLTVLAQPK